MNEPQMIHGQVEMVSVVWLLKNITHSVDFYQHNGVDWQEVVEFKSFSSHFDGIVDALMTKGFRIPVCVELGLDGDVIMGNGHHRLTAAILLGLDSVPVFWSEDGDYMHSESTEDDENMPIDRHLSLGIHDLLYS